jgi:DNA helicase-2/ATP-dependent DNA helicase PcrA
MTPNPEQQIIIDFRKGVAVVAAAAGSGKSTVLVERSARLIDAGVSPSRILLLAFNASARTDMRAKLCKRLGVADADLKVAAGTFHAWGRSRVREVYKAAGKPMPELLESAAYAMMQQTIMSTVYPTVDAKTDKRFRHSIETKPWLALSAQAREALCWLDADHRAADEETMSALKVFADLELPGAVGAKVDAATAWSVVRAFQDAKKAAGRLDFSDMLWIPCMLIKKGSRLAVEWQSRYDHVQVDELQDGSPARLLIGDWLSQGAKSYLSVGDARQSIYGFTGARPDLFVAPLTGVPGGKGERELAAGVKVSAKLLTLNTNYRSGNAIIDLANRIGEGQSWNLGGATVGARQTPGAVDMRNAGGFQLADSILDEVESGGVSDDKGRSRCAVLARTRAALLPVRINARLRGIPVRTLTTDGSIWRSGAAQTIIAYLQVTEGRYEGIKRIAWTPRRFFNGAALLEATRTAQQHGADLVSVMMNQRGPIREFGEDLSVLQSLPWAERCEAISDLIVEDIESRASDKGGSAEDLSAVDTVTALCRAAAALGSLDEIEKNAREEEEDDKRKDDTTERQPALILGTCHASKGLEFSRVWVVDVDAGVFPHKRNDDHAEEHRLFYVACTRAADHLTVCHAAREGSPFVAFVAAPDAVPPAAVTPPKAVAPARTPELVRLTEAATVADSQDRTGRWVLRGRERLDALAPLLAPLKFRPSSHGLYGVVGGKEVNISVDARDTAVRIYIGDNELVGDRDYGWRTWVVDTLAGLEK